MFSLFAKIIKRAANYSKASLVIILALLLLSIIPIKNLRWELQLQDTLKGKDAQTEFQEIENAFGGLGSLIVVIQSEDSLGNYRTAQRLAQDLASNPAVHFAEFDTDIEFYKKNKFLYASESDIDTLVSRIENMRQQFIKKNNPFFVDLTQDSSALQSDSAENSRKGLLNDLEKKYFDKLETSHSNSTGTIRIVEIYPSHSLSDLQANRDLVSSVKGILEKENSKREFKFYLTGKVYASVQTGKKLLPEAKIAGGITALFILILLIIHFFRQPQLIPIAVLPLATPIVFTLALASLIYGRINLFTLMLAILLPGQACQTLNHVLNRYYEERQSKLSPHLCIESAILGIGPSTAAASFIFAALFASLTLIPLPGLQELGVMGAIGCILNWGVCILLAAALLKYSQKKSPFSVIHRPRLNNRKMTMLPKRLNWAIFISIIIASLFGYYFGGKQLSFSYDFSATELKNSDPVIDSLIEQTGFTNYSPIVLLLPNANEGEALLKNYNTLKANGEVSRIEKIFTLAQFSPNFQEAKMEKLRKLHSLISKEFLNFLSPSERDNLEKISQALEMEENEDIEPPEYIANKFRDKKGNQGVFAFVFTKINQDNGLECRRLNRDLQKIEGIKNGNYLIAGTAITRAQFIDRILSNTGKAIVLGTILVWVLLLVFYNRLSRAIFTLLPSIFAMSWLLLTLALKEVGITAYSALAFPLLIGASVDGSLQFWASYYEKMQGTALTILRRKYFSIIVSQLAALIGTYSCLISSHPGLRSIGQVVLIGMICIFAAQFTIFPLIAGSLDHYRLRKRQKARGSLQR